MSEYISGIAGWLLGERDKAFQEGPVSSGEWKESYLSLSHLWKEPADRAVAGGFLSDRLAFAFASGYASALRALVPSIPENRIAAFCVTENRSTRPADIGSCLQVVQAGADGQETRELTGRKDFVSLAEEADLFLTAVYEGLDEKGRKRIRVVMLERGMPGLSIKPGMDLPFVPEISHGTMECDRVQVSSSRILPGDGYSDYVRPFRTVEDLHVYAALLGYLLRVSFRYSWPRDIPERIMGLIAAVRCLAASLPDDPGVISAGGVKLMMDDLLTLTGPMWEAVDPEERARWERDRPLLGVASQARKARIEKAWQSAGI